MNFSMSMGHSQEQRQTLEHRMSHSQRLLVRDRLATLQISLGGALIGERFQPDACCPSCGKKMNADEILAGFNRDPSDFTTKCPKCGHRFAPHLISFGNGSQIELAFYCPSQVLGMLHDRDLAPDEFARLHPAVYRSAIAHYGTLRNAFATKGVAYPFAETDGWRAKIRPFLGKLPDTTIARAVSVSPGTIRRLRAKRHIKAFSRQKLLRHRGRRTT